MPKTVSEDLTILVCPLWEKRGTHVPTRQVTCEQCKAAKVSITTWNIEIVKTHGVRIVCHDCHEALKKQAIEAGAPIEEHKEPISESVEFGKADE